MEQPNERNILQRNEPPKERSILHPLPLAVVQPPRRSNNLRSMRSVPFQLQPPLQHGKPFCAIFRSDNGAVVARCLPSVADAQYVLIRPRLSEHSELRENEAPPEDEPPIALGPHLMSGGLAQVLFSVKVYDRDIKPNSPLVGSIGLLLSEQVFLQTPLPFPSAPLRFFSSTSSDESTSVAKEEDSPYSTSQPATTFSTSQPATTLSTSHTNEFGYYDTFWNTKRGSSSNNRVVVEEGNVLPRYIQHFRLSITKDVISLIQVADSSSGSDPLQFPVKQSDGKKKYVEEVVWQTNMKWKGTSVVQRRQKGGGCSVSEERGTVRDCLAVFVMLQCPLTELEVIQYRMM